MALAAALAVVLPACGGSSESRETEDTGSATIEREAAAAAGTCPQPGTPPVEGLIVPNRGALGVELGQSLEEVIACLGPPYVKSPDYLSYTKPPTIFDLRFEGGRLAYLNIAGAGFCLPERICLEQRGNIRLLREHFGDEVYVTKDEAGFEQLAMTGELRGRASVTRLFLHGPGGAVNQVEIAWADR
jgi:hypothetical protein